MKSHRADIVGTNECVIELQSSPIPVDHIAARETFYGNMVWVFNATERFEMIATGRRTFFSLKNTEHLKSCRKPVFLDFGSVLVEVEVFSGAIAKLDGFGRTRSREWFAQRYLSGVLKDGATPQSSGSSKPCRWYKHKRFDKTVQASQWHDPETFSVVTIPKDSICIPLNWQFKQAGEAWDNEWKRIIEQHPQIALGWTCDELEAMQHALNGKVMILDGFLRVMPPCPEEINVTMTVATMWDNVRRVDKHVAAGRIPILEDSTKQRLIRSAEAYERHMYRDLLENLRRDKQVDNQQQRLF